MFWMFLESDILVEESARHSSGGMVTLDWPRCVIDFSRCSIIHLVCRLLVERAFVYLFVFVFELSCICLYLYFNGCVSVCI